MVKNILNDDNIMLPSELGGVSHEHLVTPSRLRNNTETQTQLTQSTRTARTMRVMLFKKLILILQLLTSN